MEEQIPTILEKVLNKIASFVAFHILPKRVVHWCAIRVIAHATTGKYGNQIVCKLTAMDALDRWGK